MFKCTIEKIDLFFQVPRRRISTVFHSTVAMHAQFEKWNKERQFRYAPIEIQPGYLPSQQSEMFPTIAELGDVDEQAEAIASASKAMDRVQDSLYAHGIAEVPVNDSASTSPRSLQDHKHP